LEHLSYRARPVLCQLEQTTKPLIQRDSPQPGISPEKSTGPI
jgi:hypothetical protein